MNVEGLGIRVLMIALIVSIYQTMQSRFLMCSLGGEVIDPSSRNRQ